VKLFLAGGGEGEGEEEEERAWDGRVRRWDEWIGRGGTYALSLVGGRWVCHGGCVV